MHADDAIRDDMNKAMDYWLKYWDIQPSILIDTLVDVINCRYGNCAWFDSLKLELSEHSYGRKEYRAMEYFGCIRKK